MVKRDWYSQAMSNLRRARATASLNWDTLARAFKRTIQTCELLVTYAVAVAGKPSTQ